METVRMGSIEKVRVLVVEDTLMSRIALQTLLEELGCEVVTTSNGQEAVNRFDSTFHLIFIDYNMPVMRGDEAVKIIRQNQKITNGMNPVYIVALTADNSEKINQICLAAGVDRVIEKPIRPEILKELLNVVVLKN